MSAETPDRWDALEKAANLVLLEAEVGSEAVDLALEDFHALVVPDTILDLIAAARRGK